MPPLILALSAALALAGATQVKAAAFCAHPLAGERLTNYCLLRSIDGKTISLPDARTIDARLKNQGNSDGLGIGLPYRPRQLSAALVLLPTLEWSSNINGGNPDGPLQLGNLVFTGNPDYVRKRGWLYGASLRLGGRLIYGKQRYLDYSFSTSHSQSPKHDIGISRAGGRICGVHHLKKRWYVDTCLSSSRVWIELQNQTFHNVRLGITKIFSSSKGTHHQAKLGVERLFNEGVYEQNRLSLSLDTTHANGLLTGVGVLLGEAVPGRLVTRYAVSARAGIKLKNKPLSLSATWREARGGRLIGFAWNETTQAVGLSYRIWRGISISVGYRNTDSAIDYFDVSEPIFGLGLGVIGF